MRGAVAILLLLVGCTDAPEVRYREGTAGGEDPTEDPIPYVQYGIALLHQGRCPEAMAQGFEPALAIFERRHGERASPRASRVLNPVRLSPLEGAAEDAEDAERSAPPLGPAWSDTMYLQAFCLIEEGRMDDAAALLRRALSLIPDDVVYSCGLGHVHQQAGEHEAALERFRAARQNVAMLRAQLGETVLFGHSLSWWERRALRGEGFSLIELRRLDEAEAVYRRVLDIDPDDERAIRELQLIFARRGAI